MAKFLDSLLEYFSSPLPSNEVKDDSEVGGTTPEVLTQAPRGWKQSLAFLAKVFVLLQHSKLSSAVRFTAAQ